MTYFCKTSLPALIWAFICVFIGGPISAVSSLGDTASPRSETGVDHPDAGAGPPERVELGSVPVVLPMSLPERQKTPVIELAINGKGPFKFFLDTGAGVTVLNKDLAVELGLASIGTTKVGDPANPEAITADIYTLERIDLGGARFYGVTVISWDRAALRQGDQPRGVLGMPLFANLLLTLDYPGNQIRFAPGELPPPDQQDVLAYKPSEGGIFLVPISVAGTAMDVHLDSGSGGALMLPKSFTAQLPLAAEPVVIGRGRTVNSEFEILQAKLNGDIRIGSHSFPNPDVRFNDTLPIGHIGYGILQRFALTIDQRQHRLQFSETTMATPAAKLAAVSATANTPQTREIAVYEGTYGERTISIDSGSLYLQRAGGERLRLLPVSKDEFSLEKIPEARVRFVRSDDGNVIGIEVLNRSGVWEKAPRS